MIKTLPRERIIKEVQEAKKGAFIRLSYKSDMPIKAEFKKTGFKITKITETTGRLGVQYDNIKAVKDYKEERDAAGNPVAKPKTNNFKWEKGLENIIGTNSNTGLEYLRFAVTNDKNNKSSYVVTDSEGNETAMDSLPDDIKSKVLNSYWAPKKPGDAPSSVRTIKLDNMIRIGKVVMAQRKDEED